MHKIINSEVIDGFWNDDGIWLGVEKIDKKYYVGHFAGIYICQTLHFSIRDYIITMIVKFHGHCDSYEDAHEIWFDTEEQAREAYDWLVSKYVAKNLLKG